MVPTLLLAAVAATATPTVTPTVTATPVPAFARLLDAQGVAATPTPAPAALGSKVKLRATRITDRPDDPAALVLARRPTPEPGATAGPDSRDAQFKEQCAKLYPGKFDEQLDCVKALRAIAKRIAQAPEQT